MKKGGNMYSWHMAAWLFLILGGLNWGLVGAFDWNLIEAVFGQWPLLVDVLYILIGLIAVKMLVLQSMKKKSGKCGMC